MCWAWAAAQVGVTRLAGAGDSLPGRLLLTADHKGAGRAALPPPSSLHSRILVPSLLPSPTQWSFTRTRTRTLTHPHPTTFILTPTHAGRVEVPDPPPQGTFIIATHLAELLTVLLSVAQSFPQTVQLILGLHKARSRLFQLY